MPRKTWRTTQGILQSVRIAAKTKTYHQNSDEARRQNRPNAMTEKQKANGLIVMAAKGMEPENNQS